MHPQKALRRMLIALAGMASLMFSPAVFSQSCSLCYTQAASSGSRMIEALRSGILVLIVPPTLLWLVLMAVLYIKRNQFRRGGMPVGSNSEWS